MADVVWVGDWCDVLEARRALDTHVVGVAIVSV